MALRFNGIDIPTSGEVRFGGSSFREVRFNGIAFWQQGGDSGAPPVPSFCDASDRQHTDFIRVQWGYSSYLAGYAVYRSDDGTTFELISMVTNGDLFYEDYNVSLGVVYHYKVKACWLDDTSVCSDFSETDAGELKPEDVVNPPTEAPQSLTASDGTYFDKIVVNWQNGSEATATAVNIYRNDIFIDTVPFGVVSYIDQAVDPATSYEYFARFRNGGGEGPDSNRDTGSTADENEYVLRSGDTMDQSGTGLASPSLRVNDGTTEQDVWHEGNFDPNSKPTGSWTWDGSTLRITIP